MKWQDIERLSLPKKWERMLRANVSSSWMEKADSLTSRLNEFSRLFKSKDYKTPDDLFFAIEDLPSMGKEYWFLYFCSPPKDEQVVITLGRSSDQVKVNATSVSESDREQGVPCAAVCWYFDRKKEVVFDSSAKVSIRSEGVDREIRAEKGKSSIVLKGSYPDFTISLSREGKGVFFARARPPRQGKPYELVHMLNNPLAPRLGAVMVNYYFDFSGELCGRPISGKAYLQKVVAVIPLAPWNWVRLEFEKGASLDFFQGKPLGDAPGLHFACNDYVQIGGKRAYIKNLSLSSWLEGDKKVWVLSGKNLLAVMESYALQPFVMRQKTVFQYDEYLVRVKSFALKIGGKAYTLGELGQASGLVEDASGYLV